MILASLVSPDKPHSKHSFNFSPEISENLVTEEVLEELEITKDLTPEQKIQLTYILYHIFNYPSLREAQIHHKATRLGGYDLSINTNNYVQNNQLEKQACKEYCKCCGFVKQTENLPLCQDFEQFPTVGLSAFLFFESIRNMIYILLLVSFILAGFSLGTNLYASQLGQTEIDFQNFTNEQLNLIINSISLSSRKLSTDDTFRILYLVQMWIGVGLVIIWSFSLCFIKYFEQQKEGEVDRATKSAADFSFIIENYPKNLTKDNLQEQMDRYRMQLNPNIVDDDNNLFIVEKINLHCPVKYDEKEKEQLKKLDEKYTKQLEKVARWVVNFKDQGFKVKQKTRINQYKELQNLKNQRSNQAQKIMETLTLSLAQSSKTKNSILLNTQEDARTFAFITLKYSRGKDLIVKYNEMNFAATLRYYLSCCRSKNKLKLYRDFDLDEKQQFDGLKIYKAPEPEDILWENLETSLCEKIVRKAITYLISFILLGISFGSVYLLTIEQLKNEENFYFSIVISLTIALINVVISVLIALSTNFEGNYTTTGYQTSLAIKSIFAQLINSIFVPVLVNYILEDRNIYGKNGLSTDIIYLSIINSLLYPLVRIIDPKYRLYQIMAYYYKTSTIEKLQLKQSELNMKLELPVFEIGYEYIYFINLYLFTAFFVSLQPVIVIPAILGMLLGYWVIKYNLLNRLKRPVPGTDIISNAMGQFIGLGPIVYELGNLMWSHFLQEHQQTEQDMIFYIPNLIGIGIATLFFIFPFTIICENCFEFYQDENLEFQNSRVFLNSEYDRMNPTTMQAAIKQYELYLQNILQNGSEKVNDLNKNFYSKEHNRNENHLYPQEITEQDQLENVDQKDFNANFQTEENLSESKNQDSQIVLKKVRESIAKVALDKDFLQRKKIVAKNRARASKNQLQQILEESKLKKDILGSLMIQNLQSSSQIPSKNQLNSSDNSDPIRKPSFLFPTQDVGKKSKSTEIKYQEPEKIKVQQKSHQQSLLESYFAKKDSEAKQKSFQVNFSFPHQKVSRDQDFNIDRTGNNMKSGEAQEQSEKKNESHFNRLEYFGSKEKSIIKPARSGRYRKSQKNPYDNAF